MEFPSPENPVGSVLVVGEALEVVPREASEVVGSPGGSPGFLHFSQTTKCRSVLQSWSSAAFSEE